MSTTGRWLALGLRLLGAEKGSVHSPQWIRYVLLRNQRSRMNPSSLGSVWSKLTAEPEQGQAGQ